MASDGAVWVSNYHDDTLSRIDPSTNQVVQTVRVGSGPGFLLETASAIGCSNETGKSLSRLDLFSMQVAEAKVGDAPSGLASADGYVWVATYEDQVLGRFTPRA